MKNFAQKIMCALMVTVSVSFGMDVLPMGKESYGKETLVPQVLEVFKQVREIYRESDQRPEKLHLNIFKPYTEYLLKTMKEGDQNDHVQKLIQEVQDILEEGNIPLDWFLDAHFRYLKFMGGISEAEKAIFSHTPHNLYLKLLLEDDSPNNPVRLRALFSENENNDVPETIKVIDQKIQEHLDMPIFYPCLGAGIFPVQLLLNCWMDGIYLIGMPTTGIKKVHGEDATPLGFGYHDFFHALLDDRRNRLFRYIEKAISQYETSSQTKKSVSGFATHFVPLAVQKYYLFMSALKHAHTNTTDKLALLGKFIAFHEILKLPKSIFKFSSLSDVMTQILQKKLSYYQLTSAWENPEDPLQTSPVDGSSSLSEEQIKEIALDEAVKDQTFTFTIDGRKTEGEEKKKCVRQNWTFKIAYSSQFIDVIFGNSEGVQKTYSYPTLLRKWNNLDTSLALLKMGGILLEKPALDGVNDRDIVMGALTKVRTELQAALRHFGEKAIESFGKGEGSFASTYEAKFKAIEDEMVEIGHVLPKFPAESVQN